MWARAAGGRGHRPWCSCLLVQRVVLGRAQQPRRRHFAGRGIAPARMLTTAARDSSAILGPHAEDSEGRSPASGPAKSSTGCDPHSGRVRRSFQEGEFFHMRRELAPTPGTSCSRSSSAVHKSWRPSCGVSRPPGLAERVVDFPGPSGALRRQRPARKEQVGGPPPASSFVGHVAPTGRFQHGYLWRSLRART